MDVTNDVGTLNGAPQGGPINSISGTGSIETVTITNSTVGDISTLANDDSITIIGSTVDDVDAGSSTDTVTIGNSALLGDVLLGAGSGEVLNFYNSSVGGELNGGTGNDALNLPAGTIVNDVTHGTFTVQLGIAYIVNWGTFTLPTGQTVSYRLFDSGIGITCFASGTLIKAPGGNVRIEDLGVGDKVSTFDGGRERIRWIGRLRISGAALCANPKLRPVRIMAGALGSGLPERDLIVSRQHRMLVRSSIAREIFGPCEVLIAAIKLAGIPGIFVDEDIENVEYFHVLLDRHMTIVAEGGPSESLLAGNQALKALGAEAHAELLTLFPAMADIDYAPEPDRLIPCNKRQIELVARHLREGKPLMCDLPNTQPPPTGADWMLSDAVVSGTPDKVLATEPRCAV
ncbi:MAG: Hint domain-containing protein [Rhodobacteraceae bacterium]|nr:Hint domain-containing protein [Paracoccaceae bacterium]